MSHSLFLFLLFVRLLSFLPPFPICFSSYFLFSSVLFPFLRVPPHPPPLHYVFSSFFSSLNFLAWLAVILSKPITVTRTRQMSCLFFFFLPVNLFCLISHVIFTSQGILYFDLAANRPVISLFITLNNFSNLYGKSYILFVSQVCHVTIFLTLLLYLFVRC